MKRSFSFATIVTAALGLVRCTDQNDGADHFPRADHFPGKFTVQDGGPVETVNVPPNKYSALADALGLSEADERNFHLFGMSCDPCVTFDGGRYRMWFSAVQNNDLGGGPVPDRGEYVPAIDQLNLQGFAYSESADGVSWSAPKNLTNNVDLQIEPDVGAWDKYGLETCAVLRHPKTGEYFLYYTGKTTVEIDGKTYVYYSGIGCATSADGVTWTKRGAVITSEHPWEMPYYNSQWYRDVHDAGSAAAAGGVLEPTVIFDQKANAFKMWYAGMGETEAGNGSTWGVRMGYAVSADGISWEKRGQRIFDRGAAGSWESSWTSHYHVVADPDAGYHLFYAGQSESGSTYAIGHAYSVDGLVWSRNPDNPLLSNTAGSWHEKMTGGPSVIIKDGEYRLWFFGSRLADFSFVFFGHATAAY